MRVPGCASTRADAKILLIRGTEMSNATIPMSEKEKFNSRQVESWQSASPAWWIVLSRELADLWLGGKALYLIVAFSILLGIETFVLATNLELSMYTAQEIVFETLKSV